ncbi:MFS transporter [Austwickia chelonae]|uniref:MFS transporter n=1 Tax=Austwickia chelonae TaxID=100225 RepID=UPI0013C2E6D6|nr:MFS transporter [Austwickia chelonae]
MARKADDNGQPAPPNAVPALALTTAVAALAMSMPNVALPEVTTDFGISMETSQWVTLSYLLSSTVLVVLIGRLGDQWGRGRVLIAGIGFFAAATIMAGLSMNFGMLVASRTLQGLGAAAMTTLPMALVRESVHPEKAGRTMGLLGSSMAAGMALGPAVGGFAVAAWGWRSVFILLTALAAANLLLVASALRHPRPDPAGSRTFDVLGIALLSTFLGTYSAAVTLRPGGIFGILALLGIALAAAIAFVRVELRSTAPLVDFAVLRTANILPQLVLACAVAIIMMTFTIVPPFYLTRGLGLDNTAMGLSMAVGPIAAILSGVPAGRIVDRRGPASVVLVGLGLITVASMGFIVAPALIGLAGFLLLAITLTPGNQLFMAANNTAIMMQTGREHQGAVAGLLNVARNLGFVTGTPLVGMLFEAASTAHGGTAGALLGLQLNFAVAALIGAGAVIVGWRTFPRESRKPSVATR